MMVAVLGASGVEISVDGALHDRLPVGLGLQLEADQDDTARAFHFRRRRMHNEMSVVPARQHAGALKTAATAAKRGPLRWRSQCQPQELRDSRMQFALVDAKGWRERAGSEG
jgi:hypothetical protein